VPVTPDATVNLTADYTFALLQGEANFNATYQYNTGWFAEPDNIIRQSPFSELNLSLHWKAPNRRYTVALWAENVTDTAVQGSATTQITGVQDVTYEPPRTYGFTVGYHF
jgi:iron complex outermembrane recepter protein